MKAWGVLAAALGAVAASGAVADDVFTGANVLGVTRVESAAEYLPLAVAWGAVGASAAAPAADALVITANLKAGDELYVYDRAAGRYQVFTLVRDAAGDTWAAARVVHVGTGGAEVATGSAAAEVSLARGYGAWLHRPGAAARADKAVYLAGQAESAPVSITFAEATGSAKFGQTLFGPPAGAAGDFALNGSAIDWSGAVKGDEIRLPQTDGTLQTVEYTGAKWVRKYWERSANGILRLRRDTNPVIPRGQAAWYARKAGNAALTVTWSEE